MTGEVPEADAVEQSIPARPAAQDAAAQAAPGGGTPADATEADYLEQRTPAVPDEGPGVINPDAEASEADLLEQAEGLPGDDEDYPPAGGEFEE
ncbi:hypothetical protein [Sinomonas mesophila]|uniref:hypothetical protein n=1 Tax=Sinomonas mesophila TaxID=1531955 RepID=UPI0009849605|nr:hypothetical protein [Sinomonas mesophila]